MGVDVSDVGVGVHGRGADNWAAGMWAGKGNSNYHNDHPMTVAECKAACEAAYDERKLTTSTDASVATAYRNALPDASAKAWFDDLPLDSVRELLADHAAEQHAKGYCW